jgi:hypothetical protein
MLASLSGVVFGLLVLSLLLTACYAMFRGYGAAPAFGLMMCLGLVASVPWVGELAAGAIALGTLWVCPPLSRPRIGAAR